MTYLLVRHLISEFANAQLTIVRPDDSDFQQSLETIVIALSKIPTAEKLT